MAWGLKRICHKYKLLKHFHHVLNIIGTLKGTHAQYMAKISSEFTGCPEIFFALFWRAQATPNVFG